MTPVIEIQNVTKTYMLGEVEIRALDNVSIKIDQGEFVSIVGKSGSGKSTLMHIMGLLDTPTSGSVFLNGSNTADFSETQLAKVRNKEIGFVFQSFNLLRRTTALENVMLPLRYSQIPKSEWKQKAVDILNTVELGDRLANKSNELSGGQRQRVAIARALVNDPSIILADEPTGNLDSKTGDEIIQVFNKLHEKGITIVLVTHDEDIASVADRKIFIKDGKVV